MQMVALKQEISSLKIIIINAFSDVEFPGNDKILYVEDYDDDSEILDFYGLDDWQSIPDGIIERNNGALSCFSPEAYQFYIPRFLIYVLDNYDLDEMVIDHTIYNLAPLYLKKDDIRDYRISQFEHLTRNQKKVIVSFLELITDHFIEDMDEKAVKSALDYWHNEIK